MISDKSAPPGDTSGRSVRKLIVFIYGMGCGGAERVVANLMPEWVRQGHDVTLMTFSEPSTDFYSIPPTISRVVLGGAGESPNIFYGIYANLSRLKKLRSVLREQAPDTVVSFMTSTNVLLVLASIGLKTRVILSERNDPSRERTSINWRFLRGLTYRHADVVTANLSLALENMASYVPESKLCKLPNPVELPETLARPDRSLTVLSVGRLVPEKRHDLVLEAFERVADHHPSLELSILGDGPLRRNLQDRISSAGISAKVNLPGKVLDPNHYYRACGIFVLASEYEGTPNALLEAMAHGLPCVVPDSLPGALEYVEEGVTGLIYPAMDVDAFAERISMLAKDPELRRRLGQAARERVSGLSVHHVVDQWNAVLFPESSA